MSSHASGRDWATRLGVTFSVIVFLIVGVCGGLFAGTLAATDQGEDCNQQICNLGPDPENERLGCYDEPDLRRHCTWFEETKTCESPFCRPS